MLMSAPQQLYVAEAPIPFLRSTVQRIVDVRNSQILAICLTTMHEIPRIPCRRCVSLRNALCFALRTAHYHYSL
ncbi:hypothetical protein VTO73DRAFT_13557 [Trametes versicolor]